VSVTRKISLENREKLSSCENCLEKMLKVFLLVLAGLATVVVANPIETGAASDGLVGIAPFITGGREVNPRNSKPYQAFIDTQFNSYYSWCGASIISQNYILTAKHCLVK
jgi:secreted trypsin-like serine protease